MFTFTPRKNIVRTRENTYCYSKSQWCSYLFHPNTPRIVIKNKTSFLNVVFIFISSFLHYSLFLIFNFSRFSLILSACNCYYFVIFYGVYMMASFYTILCVELVGIMWSSFLLCSRNVCNIDVPFLLSKSYRNLCDSLFLR